jgi:aminoglycoside phosphotransferase (APT) family kinase protein
MTGAVSDDELLAALGAHRAAPVEVSSRQPYRYATSAPLEWVRVRAADGSTADLILKDLARDRLLGDARASKPEDLWEPRRELEAYRQILSPEGIGAKCAVAVGGQRPWLLIEKVPGVELWQVGELDVWERVAAWLGEVHAHFGGREDELRAANPHLLDLDQRWWARWHDRASRALTESSDPRAHELLDALSGYEVWTAELSRLPRTLVHGELYPSNVIVDTESDPVRVCPVDWEMAGIGPGVVDLAALVGGWDGASRDRLILAYRTGLAGAGITDDAAIGSGEGLSVAQLHYALQWLGWSTRWQPPREHSHDWLGEALALANELGRG